MPSSARRWTVDDLAALPDDGNRYEIIDGELLVTPAPSWRHQRLVRALFKRLIAYLEAHPVGEVLTSPADVAFSRDTSVQPDLFVVPLMEGRSPASFAEVGRLLLAIEVLSPGTMRHDRYEKRPLFQRERVPECWIVDGHARVVERWHPGDGLPEILQHELTWQPDLGHEPLVIDFREIFREAEGRGS